MKLDPRIRHHRKYRDPSRGSLRRLQTNHGPDEVLAFLDDPKVTKRHLQGLSELAAVNTIADVRSVISHPMINEPIHVFHALEIVKAKGMRNLQALLSRPDITPKNVERWMAYYRFHGYRIRPTRAALKMDGIITKPKKKP